MKLSHLAGFSGVQFKLWDWLEMIAAMACSSSLIEILKRSDNRLIRPRSGRTTHQAGYASRM
jgi:hypothetical protein